LETGGTPVVNCLGKPDAKKPQTMVATITPAERKAIAQEVLLLFANGQWEMAHNILEIAQDEEWLFDQLLNGCKIEDGQLIPSNVINKSFKKEDKNSPVLAMLNIMLCNPSSSKILKSLKFELLKGELILDRLTSLSDGAAEALSKCKGDLKIDKLASLSDSSGHVALAVKLASQKTELYLRGLESLSDGAAEALSKHEGELLFLDGLSSLSDAGAEALSKHKGDLYLRGLESLSDAGAEALSKHKGNLDLRGLESLSDAAAEALSKHKGELDLHGLKSLSDTFGHVALAKKLAYKHWGLDLSGLKSLSDTAAEALSKHKGNLDLRGLKSLSDAGAEALSKHKKTLDLSGLTSLSDAGAEALSKHEGTLELSRLRLTSLSDAGAEALSKNKRYVNIEDYDLDP
jgi:predicted CopG family antitoxin